MAKTHSVTWRGMVGAAVVGAIVLSATDTAKEKVNNTADVGKEIICAGQTLLGGVLNSSLIDCAGRGPATDTSTSSGGVSGD